MRQRALLYKACVLGLNFQYFVKLPLKHTFGSCFFHRDKKQYCLDPKTDILYEDI